MMTYQRHEHSNDTHRHADIEDIQYTTRHYYY